MTRSARPLMHNVSYHIITRGIRREKVFLEDKDFSRYLHNLWRYKNRFSAKVHAYCLMSNHVHLLIEPADPADLKRIMHGIDLSYSSYFNYKYKRSGHLWQNRYKSFIVQNDEDLVNVVSYIEFNPVRTNICTRAEDYLWCSYRSRVTGRINKVLDTRQ